ncbi:DUF6580 family putative transport protein [Mucilaginibacter glaciei]|uniref:Uncharacterized protein n=1 Tax=Mucilaginibacter glaciei TaxID=2772109 RepID=A0A926NNG6_9SPHI|nr:DUF6580 family putative transport protein [Mucilaginibacter glaciei]MBD1392117.1 hypothetical protein [Mucilaginibacter glaciei]
MSSQKTNIRTSLLILMVIVAMAMRLVNTQFLWLSNFTPVGAIALFGGTYFTDKWKAYAVPIAALFVSDMLINYMYTSKFIVFYSSSLWMYSCFAMMVFIGTLIKKVNVANVAVASIAAVLVHWLIMDLPFLYGTMYTHDLKGYGVSLVAAIPFEKNMLIADAVYGAILFGGFELAKSKFEVLRPRKELAL